MDGRIVVRIVLILLLTVGVCRAAECEKACAFGKASEPAKPDAAKADAVDAVLKELNAKTLDLKTYQGLLEYKFLQPLLESEAMRKGALYYAKFGEKSKLRINFQTLKQDDEKEQKYIEHYIFDGIWLTQINYQIKAVRRYQLAEPNEPMDAFSVASRNLPLIGFTKTDDLKKEFEVTLVEQKSDKATSFIQLHLKVKPNSIYRDDYVSLDFWIDKKLGLPTKVIAVSAGEEEEIYELRFLKPKVNKRIDKKVFEFKIPKGFGEPEIIPLEKKRR